MLFLMSTSSMVLCESFLYIDSRRRLQKRRLYEPSTLMVSSYIRTSRRFVGSVPNAKNRGHSKKRPWWQKFFSDEDEDDILSGLDEESEEGMSEEEKFLAWKMKAEAISELRKAQEDVRSDGSRDWEDWIISGPSDEDDRSSWDRDWGGGDVGNGGEDGMPGPGEIVPIKEFSNGIRDLVFRNYDDELLFEDRVFQYASLNSVKFLAFLVIIPWALDFAVHDYVLMPFLDRYVKTVPLAAKMLDVRKSQKLEMVKTLKVDKARFRFEVEIGKSPPLNDEEVWLELRHKAMELRDEWRLENRRAFANIWSDMVYGIVLFILIYFNQSQVALLKFTGYKLINNISDTGKAFLIILITDIFLGYHSASGWQALLEILLERYGFEVDQAAVTIFICFVPVVVDACVKFWLFKFLPRLSPNVANIFREMKRH
ncbi:Chloroplast envelope membrane protein [Acorus calamus]|uniref:Chloroplast envelope membrane protein n=1 Tax=Acorus calamus TaxID=4465 RepID=A0AAV9ERC7_ACOCL|nr:Chloroplast envelope membrane protein [Acorus calamus]